MRLKKKINKNVSNAPLLWSVYLLSIGPDFRHIFFAEILVKRQKAKK